MQSAKTIRVLVVEDEPIVGMAIGNFLGGFGYSVLGPIENLKAAILLAATEQIDVAVVDINIEGQVATAVADKLIERKIPFLFVSGHGNQNETRMPPLAKTGRAWWSFWLFRYWVFLKPRLRLLGNPLPRLRTRPKIVNMLSDAIWPLGIHMPAASIQEGIWGTGI